MLDAIAQSTDPLITINKPFNLFDVHNSIVLVLLLLLDAMRSSLYLFTMYVNVWIWYSDSDD